MRRRRGGEDPADVNVTPLLDIVFIMLIFFIVTATFVYEDGIEPNLPQSDDSDNTQPPPTLLLTVQPDGFVLVDDVRRVDPRSVESVVSQFLAKERDGVVIINAEGEARTGTTMTVLDMARLGAGPDLRDSKISLALAGQS